MIETRFKDTDVGRIPEDWEVKTLGDIGSFRKGRGISRQDATTGTIPAVRYGELYTIHDFYIKKFGSFVSEKIANSSIRLNKGDILFTCSGETKEDIGKSTAFVSDCEAYAGGDLIVLSPYSEYDPLYLGLVTNSPKSREQKASKGQGDAVVHISSKEIASVSIPIPSKSEQSRIATALSTIDTLISELVKLIEKKRDIKQGAMQQLLTGKKRLKGFSEPWVEKKLGEICDVKRGVRVTRETLTTEGQFPVFQNTNYPLGYFNKYNVAANTPFVIVGGSAGLVGFSKNKYWAADDCAYFDNCEELNLVFLYYILLLRQNEIKRHVRTASVPRLDRKNIEDLVILIPSLIEQSAIASALTSMDDEISALEAKKAKYEQIKQGMMQQLLTGRIRLVDTVAKTSTTTANVHFRRSVLAAEIADRLCEEPTFGHVKMEKMLFLTERLCHIDIGSHYHRDAAGPYDNNALRSIDSQLKKQKWFEVRRTEKGNRYVPMQNRGNHKTYFNRYYSDVASTFDKIINTFKSQRTEQCEIVATLYSAWEDLLHSNKSFTDADVVNEVLNNWHESKKRISKERWLTAIQWMRENGFAPNV